MRSTIHLNDREARIVQKLARSEDVTSYRVVKRLVEIGLERISKGRDLFDITEANTTTTLSEIQHSMGVMKMFYERVLGLQVESSVVLRAFVEQEFPGLAEQARKNGKPIYDQFKEEIARAERQRP